MRASYWQKLEEAKKKGMTAEEIEKLENLESAIAYHQNKVDEYEKEIEFIENTAKARLLEESEQKGGTLLKVF